MSHYYFLLLNERRFMTQKRKSTLFQVGTTYFDIHLCLVDCCWNHPSGKSNHFSSEYHHNILILSSWRTAEILQISPTITKLMVCGDYLTGIVFTFWWWQCQLWVSVQLYRIQIDQIQPFNTFEMKICISKSYILHSVIFIKDSLIFTSFFSLKQWIIFN